MKLDMENQKRILRGKLDRMQWNYQLESTWSAENGYLEHIGIQIGSRREEDASLVAVSVDDDVGAAAAAAGAESVARHPVAAAAEVDARMNHRRRGMASARLLNIPQHKENIQKWFLKIGKKST